MNVNARTKKYLQAFFADENELDNLLTDPILIRAATMIEQYEISRDLNFLNDISRIIDLYKQCYSVISADIILILMRQDVDIVNNNNIWHKKREKIQVIKGSKDNYDIFETVIDLIGDITEGVLKYHFREIYQMLYYLSEKTLLTEDKLLKINLGVMNNELLNKCEEHLAHLFKTSLPLQYKFSNWRNMCQHKNYIINDDSIILFFEIGGTKTEHTLSVADILGYYSEIVRAANVFQIARAIFIPSLSEKVSNFVLDYAKENMGLLPKTKQELLIKDFEIVLSSKGLEVETIYHKKNSVTVLVKEKNGETEPLKHAIYLSYMLYKVWGIFKKQIVQIKYVNSSDQPYCLLSTNQEICEKIEKTRDLNLLSENFDFTIYNTN